MSMNVGPDPQMMEQLPPMVEVPPALIESIMSGNLRTPDGRRYAVLRFQAESGVVMTTVLNEEQIEWVLTNLARESVVVKTGLIVPNDLSSM